MCIGVCTMYNAHQMFLYIYKQTLLQPYLYAAYTQTLAQHSQKDNIFSHIYKTSVEQRPPGVNSQIQLISVAISSIDI